MCVFTPVTRFHHKKLTNISIQSYQCFFETYPNFFLEYLYMYIGTKMAIQRICSFIKWVFTIFLKFHFYIIKAYFVLNFIRISFILTIQYKINLAYMKLQLTFDKKVMMELCYWSKKHTFSPIFTILPYTGFF